jgi:hypothetical protein
MSVINTLLSLRPGAKWNLHGDTISWTINKNGENVPINLEWLSADIEMPTQEQIETRMVELQAIADSIAYQSQRRQEYPPLENLADALFWQANGDNSKMTEYLAQVAAVKEKYPKGTV